MGWCLFLGVLAAGLFLAARPAAQASGPVNVICIQTGNDADATLLYQQGAAVLIDTGEQEDAAGILETMTGLGIERLDYLILSHPDADHIGGAMEILRQIPAGCVVQPYCTVESELLSELNAWLAGQDIPVLYPTHTRRLKAGKLQLLVYPPLEKHYHDTNNYSLAVLARHGNVSMLFTGDAQRKRSEELLLIDWPQVDLYKVPNHGRANQNTQALFSALRPTFAVVTSKSADQAVLDAARECDTALFYTAPGDCIFVSDGHTLAPK